jgi:hypothetical protein
MLRTASSLPLHRAFDTGLRPRPFPDEAASLLPGHLAATRTGLPPASDDELTNHQQIRYVTELPPVLLGARVIEVNPRAVRIRPSNGDGGIDVIQMNDDGWIVDQIKYFHSNLTASQKRQVVDSLETVQAFAAERGATIVEWHLVTPLDPTKENRLDWFSDITEDADFTCEWRGKAHVEGWAAEFPDVIDYYLYNGNDRLESLIKQIAPLCRLFNQSDSIIQHGVPEPADMIEGLRAVYGALNAHDPHFHYSFAVDQEMPGLPDAAPGEIAVLQVDAGSCWLTFKISQRYDTALLDRPIPILFTASFSEDSRAANAVLDFHEYGAPLDLSVSDGASFSITVDLPGGLGALLPSESVGRVSFLPTPAPTRPGRMQLLDADGNELAVVSLDMQPVVTNSDTSGAFMAARERYGVFAAEFRLQPQAKRLPSQSTVSILQAWLRVKYCQVCAC